MKRNAPRPHSRRRSSGRKRSAGRIAGGATGARRGSRARRSGAPKPSRREERRSGKTEHPLLTEPAIAVATAKEAASLTSTLSDQPAIVGAEAALEEALEEAEQVKLLLEEEDENDDLHPEPEEEDEYFLKGPAKPARPRPRPAPAIVAPGGAAAGPRGTAAPGGAAAAPAATIGAPATAGPEPPPAPAIPGAEHLFPRNLTLRYPVAVKAQGIWIEDSDGKRYLDGSGGAVVCSIGHGVEEIAAVMAAQAKRLAFAHSSQFITRETMGLAARIAALAPGDMRTSGRVYLVSGGSEAVETAIKMARQYHVETGHPGRSKIIGRWQSYHGSTMGALAVTGNVARRELYTPLFAPQPHIPPCYCYRCPYDLKFPRCAIACVEDLEAAIRQEGPETVAAFIAEPVVGATLGAVPAVDGYWQRAREICTRYNVLLIADEVMTGVGRTGRNFAVDHWKVVPDLIVAGKGLSGGYAPLGAVVARGFVADGIARGRGFFEHGFTYSANPLSAAVGSAVLDYVAKHRLIVRAARMGQVLGGRLQALRRRPIVGDVRGLGMMWGIELVQDRRTKEPFPPALKAARRLYDACMAEGLIIYPGTGTREGQDGDHFIVAPAFTITRAEIDDLVSRLERGLARVETALR